MHRFRCLAHAAVTGTALAMWALVGWGILTQPQPENLMRLPWFSALGLACVTTGLALVPLVSGGRGDDTGWSDEDVRAFGRAMRADGIAEGLRRAAPEQPRRDRPLRAVAD